MILIMMMKILERGARPGDGVMEITMVAEMAVVKIEKARMVALSLMLISQMRTATPNNLTQ